MSDRDNRPRGGGGGRGWRGGRGGGRGRGLRPVDEEPSSEGTPLTLQLTLDDVFHRSVLESSVRPEGFTISGLGASLADESGDHVLSVHTPAWQAAHLKALVAWFDKHCDSFGVATLAFPAGWPKCDRATLHRFGEAVGLPTRSQGVGTDRRVCLLSPGAADAADAAAARDGGASLPDERAVDALLAAARSVKQRLSRGEAAELLAKPALPPALASALTQMELARALHAAAGAGDAAAVHAILADKSAAQVAQLTAVQLPGGDTALHAAARSDCAACLELLLAKGADAEAVDGRGRTPLAAARRAEACEAEGVLLKSGAKDPAARRAFTAPLPRLGGTGDAAAGAQAPAAGAKQATKGIRSAPAQPVLGYTGAHLAAAAAAGLLLGAAMVTTLRR